MCMFVSADMHVCVMCMHECKCVSRVFVCNIWIVISSTSLSLCPGSLMGIEVYQGTRGRLEVEDELWLRGKNIKTDN